MTVLDYLKIVNSVPISVENRDKLAFGLLDVAPKAQSQEEIVVPNSSRTELINGTLFLFEDFILNSEKITRMNIVPLKSDIFGYCGEYGSPEKLLEANIQFLAPMYPSKQNIEKISKLQAALDEIEQEHSSSLGNRK